jgi:hypothetical protein
MNAPLAAPEGSDRSSLSLTWDLGRHNGGGFSRRFLLVLKGPAPLLLHDCPGFEKHLNRNQLSGSCAWGHVVRQKLFEREGGQLLDIRVNAADLHAMAMKSATVEQVTEDGPNDFLTQHIPDTEENPL